MHFGFRRINYKTILGIHRDESRCHWKPYWNLFIPASLTREFNQGGLRMSRILVVDDHRKPNHLWISGALILVIGATALGDWRHASNGHAGKRGARRTTPPGEELPCCHSLDGRGGKRAPDFVRSSGRSRTPALFASAMWNHGPKMWSEFESAGQPVTAFGIRRGRRHLCLSVFAAVLLAPGQRGQGPKRFRRKALHWLSRRNSGYSLAAIRSRQLDRTQESHHVG